MTKLYRVGTQVRVKDDLSGKVWFVLDTYQYELGRFAYGLVDGAGGRLYWIAEELIESVSAIITNDELDAWFKLT